MSDNFPRGRFVWYDLMTSNPQEGQAFYKALIPGWETEAWEGGGKPYTMWANDGKPLGGTMELPEEARAAGAPPHWLAYIATPDADATAARAQELGGEVLSEPMDIPTVGRFAILADPQGAVFAAFTPATAAPGHDGSPLLGEFSWHELITTDHAAAFGFYTELFDWQKGEAMDMGPAGTYQMYGQINGLPECPLGGMFNKTAEMPGPPAWLFYIRVENVQNSAKRVEELGGKVLVGPMEVPGGDWVVHCMDPQGAAFALHHVTEPAVTS
ncbi:MAG: VOC family protein [Deltaproteobacteria bacterium]|nr:VOC family protein [Deltaproteobacteria bacterium]